MDYHKTFKEEYNRVLSIKSESYKKLLIDSKSNRKSYNKVSNTELKNLNIESSKIFKNYSEDFNSLLRIYKNRGQEYEVEDESEIDEELIIKNELFEKFSNSSIADNMGYEEFIIKFSRSLAIQESSRIIQNSYSYFSLVYKNNSIEQDYIFDSDSYKVNAIHRALVNKIYPEPNDMDSKLEQSKKLMIFGIEFSRKEYAHYYRTERNCINKKLEIKDLFEKIKHKNNDPFNEGDKYYKNTTLYKYLKDERLYEKEDKKYRIMIAKCFLASAYSSDDKLYNYFKKEVTKLQ